MRRVLFIFAFSTATLFTTAQPADTIQFSWQVNAPNETKQIDFGIDNDSQFFAINWGDGNIDTLLTERDWIYHTYVFARNYTVTISCDTNHEEATFVCFGQNATALDIDRFSKMRTLACWDNHLQLSDLYKVSEKIDSKRLGPQRLIPQTVLIGDSVDYSSQKEFGDTATVFEVEKNGFPAVLNTDYTIVDGIIVFKTAGKFTVTMTNSAIISDPYGIWPPIVIAEINVVYPNADATLSFLGVSHGELTPDFDSTIVNYTVCISNDVHEVLITATPTDTNATVSGNIGWQMITKDTTVLIVTVTAQDGIATKNYYVTVIRCNVGIVEIESEELQIKSYEIFDILGNCLHSSPSSPENTIITEIPRLPRGIYIIKTQTNKGTIIRKIINNQ